MALGSVILDLASERGGNCEISETGKTVVKQGSPLSAPSILHPVCPTMRVRCMREISRLFSPILSRIRN